ncbi:MAG: right-handed parallel beta-helix repeat-containing protein [Thermoplasmata archaeon]|nr:MAG: right-handed parallel beta-helix repeat-containing protein [Thermoplasmata archaeon]
MFDDSHENRWTFEKKLVSGIVTALFVFGGLAVLLPLSSDTAMGYTMPDDVSWDMDDLVANSGGIVTSPGAGDYTVHEDIEIPFNSSLTVNAGDTVYFDSGCGISVNGSLSALGTNVSLITFAPSSPSPIWGEWDGISFYGGDGGGGNNVTSGIDYADISYAENGVLIVNTSLSVTNSEFLHNVWGIHLIEGDGYIAYNTFNSNGIFPHPDPYFCEGGGIYADASSTGSIIYNDFNENIGGIRTETALYSYLYIMENNILDSTVYGIYCTTCGDYWQGYVNIMGNEIHFNDYYGIYATFGYESYISGNNITYNKVGIHLGGFLLTDPGTSGGSIHNNYIAYNTEPGIECYGGREGQPPTGGYPSISNNDIIGNEVVGVYLYNCSPYMVYNDFIDNYYGLYGHESEFTVEEGLFDSNEYAVWANSSDIIVKNCDIVSGVIQDYYLQYDAYITSLNTSFGDYSVIIEDDLSALEVRWYLHVLVVNTSGPVASADVTVSDNANGTWVQGFVTGSDGRVRWIEVVEYIRELYTWVYYTPHNITASKGSEAGYAEVFIDESQYVVIDISPGVVPQPPLPPTGLDIILVPGSLSDLELSWGASPDDGAGENDVVGYNIYRTESVDGPYTYMDTVLANGSSVYTWVDLGSGDGDPGNYFYIVRAEDGDGLEDDNQNRVGKFVSELVSGWNMISVPLVQGDTARETVLQTLGIDYLKVQGYHAGKSRPWLSWHRNKPHYFNDVIEMDHKKGYYIDMLAADDLVTAGKVADQVEINLKSGWNLVGNPCLTSKLRDDALQTIAGSYNMVERFDTATDREVRLESSDYMHPGEAFWIHATEDCVWTVSNPAE